MELFDRLDVLEKRISDLLAELERLREDNREMKETAKGLADLRSENDALKEALEKEKQTRQDIDNRIDALLNRIRAYTQTGEEREREEKIAP